MKKQTKKAKVAPQKPLTDAQRRLVNDNIDFAMNMGRKFAGLGRIKGVPVEDLQQEACYGLCIAAQRYKGGQGAEFQTYATEWCRKFVLMAIANQAPGALLLSPEGEDLENVFLPEEDGHADASLSDMDSTKVQEMLGLLNKNERRVVCLVYGLSYGSTLRKPEPMSFMEIATLLKMRSSRVHQIYEVALGKLEMAFIS